MVIDHWSSPQGGGIGARLGIIGGTGMEELLGASASAERVVATPYGECRIIGGELAEGLPVLFIARSGAGHRIPPHRVNYAGNIWALRELGAEAVVGINAVGGLGPEIPVGTLVIVDQFLDFTRRRKSTFFEDPSGPVVHTDFTVPYCPTLRNAAVDGCVSLGIPYLARGTYVCVEGPRYECPAEIRMYRQLGGDVVGMTGLPEVVLAREAGLCYACLAVVCNSAAGSSGAHLISHEEVEDLMHRMRPQIAGLIRCMGESRWRDPGCLCRRSTQTGPS